MNYFNYIEEQSGKIQELLDKQNLGLCRIDENLIVSMPLAQIQKDQFVTPKELVLYVIEGEQRVETYNSTANEDGILADLCKRAPYMISGLMLAATAKEHGMKAALAFLIPIGAAFILTNMITRRLDRKERERQLVKEEQLTQIISNTADSSIRALRRRQWDDKVADRSEEVINRAKADLGLGRDVYVHLIKLQVGKYRRPQNG